MSRKKIITTIVAIVISAIFLYFAFRNIKLKELWETFRSVKWIYVVPVSMITWLSFWWRAWRWQKLLQPTNKCRIWPLLGPTMIGFGFNNIFPARAGEFARPLALKKQEDVPFTTGLSTLVLERMFDILALLALFILVVLFIEFPPDFVFNYGDVSITPETIKGIAQKTMILAIVGFAGAIAMLSSRVRELVLRVMNAVPFIPTKIKKKVEHLFETFVNGFHSLKSPLLVLEISFHTILVWLLMGLSIWVLGFAFPNLELSLFDSGIFLVITCIVVAIPSVPGYWGVYEVGGQIALVLAGVVANDAAGLSAAMSFTLLIHFLHWIVSTACGLYYAAKIHVSASDVSQVEQPAA